MLLEEKQRVGQRHREKVLSFFPTQPSSPDVYGLYKLLRARECPPLQSRQQKSNAGAQTYHQYLRPNSLTVNPYRHTSPGDRQLRNTSLTILQKLSIITTSKSLSTLHKISLDPFSHLFPVSDSSAFTFSLF